MTNFITRWKTLPYDVFLKIREYNDTEPVNKQDQIILKRISIRNIWKITLDRKDVKKYGVNNKFILARIFDICKSKIDEETVFKILNNLPIGDLCILRHVLSNPDFHLV